MFLILITTKYVQIDGLFFDSIYYRTSDNTFIPISNSEKPVAGNKCYVQTKDIIIHPLTEYLSNDINQCGATSCHTCNIFVNNQSFKSNLTGKEYKTISYDRLSCGSTNVIYGIHCVHCGLVYVGETGRSLRSRMNGHRSAIKKGGQSLLHRHFHQPDHSVDDMSVQILEKVYHGSENPTLLTSLRRTRELFWIKELGTAKPYGFNDQIKGVGTLSSISCKKTNIYSLFNKQPRRKRSHGKRHYNKRTPQPDATTSDLVDMIEKPEGVHDINTKLFSISYYFKGIVHPGDFENKCLLLDPCHLMVHSFDSIFGCILPLQRSPLRSSVKHQTFI